MNNNRNNNLRDESGNFKSNNRFIYFVYLLLRNKVLAGDIENILRESISDIGKDVVFSNGFLAEYAANIVNELEKASEEIVEKDILAVIREIYPLLNNKGEVLTYLRDLESEGVYSYKLKAPKSFFNINQIKFVKKDHNQRFMFRKLDDGLLLIS